MLFCVFSFNRGRFLQNCVDSIERCAPFARIAVFDDDSYDEETVACLERISSRHAVMRPGGRTSHKLGGLYGNMQAALEYASNEDLVCFIQDDMQLVRFLRGEEVEEMKALISSNESIAFLQPCFLKGSNRKRDQSTLSYSPDTQCYSRGSGNQSAGMFFSAVSVVNPKKLLSRGWVFERTEPENDLKAKTLFGRIAHLYAPFAMYLPEVPAYRGKRKTLALRIAERRRGVGFFPFRIMSDEEANSFCSRAPEVLPVAEDFLRCSHGSPSKPWAYYPLQGSGLLRKLNVLELAFRRWFKVG